MASHVTIDHVKSACPCLIRSACVLISRMLGLHETLKLSAFPEL